MTFDPVGPGTPAWKQFDLALQAYCRCPEGQHNGRSKDYKQYSNHRDYMVKCLERAGIPNLEISIWLATLIAECKGRPMDEHGEYK